MPQTNFNLAPTPGVPGQVFDMSVIGPGDIVTGACGVVLGFGLLCEIVLATGVIQPVKDLTAAWPPSAGSLTRLWGISIYDPYGAEQQYVPYSVPPSTTGSSALGYPIGRRAPFLRRGRIWMAYDGGGTPPRLGAFNVWHSSDGTHLQGVATLTATSTTVGAEIGAAPVSMEVFNPELTSGSYTDSFGVAQGILCVSINLPGSGS